MLSQHCSAVKAVHAECAVKSHAESKLQCLESITCKGTSLYILWQAAVFINELMGFCEKPPGNTLCRTYYEISSYFCSMAGVSKCLSILKLHTLTTQVCWCTAFQQHPGPGCFGRGIRSLPSQNSSQLISCTL